MSVHYIKSNQKIQGSFGFTFCIVTKNLRFISLITVFVQQQKEKFQKGNQFQNFSYSSFVPNNVIQMIHLKLFNSKR